MSNAERILYRQLRRTSEQYQLLEPGDHVMVAMSGGKDSYTLFQLLQTLVPRLPFSVRLTAVHLDQRQPGYDGAPLVDWLKRTGSAFEILSEDTYGVVMDKVGDSGTYCALCSRLRRGILYSAAERLGCNKIALGHHRDDSLETFLLNLFFAGRMQAMPARYTTDDGRFAVIRPLVECAEEHIVSYAEGQAFPILPCNLCGSQTDLKRDRMTALLKQLEAMNPNVKSVMMSALANVAPTHLLDQDLAKAWAARPADLRQPRAAEQRPPHALALPVIAHPGLDPLG